MKERILEVLNDHELWLKDKERFDYIAGLIEHRVMMAQAEKNLRIERIELHKDIHGKEYDAKKATGKGQYDFSETTAEKISEFDPDGIEYSEFAHLSTDRPEEVTRDGDGKKLTERRVKSYGFFKNEYYDD
jgi:hypothetical protein